MHLQQVIISDVDFAIFQQSLSFLNDSVEIFTLKYIVTMKAVCIQILYEILSGIAIISHLQRENLVFLDQVGEPSIAIVIVYKVITG